MQLRNIDLNEMTRRLNKRGELLTEQSLRNKLNRGAFNAIFFIKCLKALDVKSVDFDLFEDPIVTDNVNI